MRTTMKRNKSFHYSMASIALAVIVPLLAIRRHHPKVKHGDNVELSSSVSSNSSLLVSGMKEFFPSLVLLMVGVAVLLTVVIIGSAYLRTKQEGNKEQLLQEATNEEILQQLRQTLTAISLATVGTESTSREYNEQMTELDKDSLILSLKCLSTLAKRCGEKQKLVQQSKRKGKRGTKPLKASYNSSNEVDSTQACSTILDDELERICQHAAFLELKYHTCNDQAVSASLALLALIAKDASVRSRLRTATKGPAVKMSAVKTATKSADGQTEGDTTEIDEMDRNVNGNNDVISYSIAVPIQAMRDALSRAKQCVIEEHDREDEQQRTHFVQSHEHGSSSSSSLEQQEQLSAELQRKGCLFLGAIADENKDMATAVVDASGLDAILDAMDWFRFHEDVVNWALWSIFVLCYDHLGNKGELIRSGGLERICRVMKDIPRSMEVQRHGTAILFDGLREVPGSIADVAQMRLVALNAGVRDVVQTAMANFPQCAEIMMMGQQMLLATRYVR